MRCVNHESFRITNNSALRIPNSELNEENFRLFGGADASGRTGIARPGTRHIKLDLRLAGSLAAHRERSGMLSGAAPSGIRRLDDRGSPRAAVHPGEYRELDAVSE